MRIIRISSDSDSEDDMPLRVFKNGCIEDPNTYQSLCRPSYEACEFCDKISKNRFSSLIHNVTHIIIPLINQTVVQCKTCLHHFTSEVELKKHTILKHHNPIVYINLTKTEPTYFGTQNVGEGIGRSNKLEIQPFSRPIIETHLLESVTEDSESSNISIKNRLVFEDDLTCGRLLNDLTTDCKVNLESFETPLLTDELSAKSVHYNELVKPGVYRCKRCGKGFPVRFDAIIHETSHLTFKNSQISLCVICNDYIQGDIIKLKRHYLNYHKEKYKKHTDVHTQYDLCEKSNGNLSHEEKYLWKIVNMCELCFSFCKNKTWMYYELVETLSEMGKRYKCEQCGSRFFEIKRVKRSVVKRRFTRKKIKKKSNEDRLKMIQNRFKMLK